MSDKPDASSTSNDGLDLLAAAANLQSLNAHPLEDSHSASYWDKRRRNNEAARRSRQKRRVCTYQLENTVEELHKENGILKAQLDALVGQANMDLRKGAADPGQPTPSGNDQPPLNRLSAFTPLSSHGLSLPPPPASTAQLGMRFVPTSSDMGRTGPDVSAAYNAIAAANLFANLANNPSVVSYLYGLNSQTHGQIPMNLGRLPPAATSAFSPSTTNPVLKELITASMGGSKPHGGDHRRQSPDTTTGQNPGDLSHAKHLLRDSLLHKASIPSPSLPDSGSHGQPPVVPGIPTEALLPPVDLRQLSVQVPTAPMSSGPNSVSSIGTDKSKDGRYLERRKRNNEAAKRCRANRRALFEYRFKRSQELEVENAELKTQISKLRMELSNLQELIKSRGLQIEPSPAQEAVQPPENIMPEDCRESGHESDFSSYGDRESHPDPDVKKAGSMGSWSSPSPESGVASPADHAMVVAAPEDHE